MFYSVDVGSKKKNTDGSFHAITGVFVSKTPFQGNFNGSSVLLFVRKGLRGLEIMSENGDRPNIAVGCVRIFRFDGACNKCRLS